MKCVQCGKETDLKKVERAYAPHVAEAGCCSAICYTKKVNLGELPDDNAEIFPPITARHIKECQGCGHRLTSCKGFCYMFETMPGECPCAQHTKFAPERNSYVSENNIIQMDLSEIEKKVIANAQLIARNPRLVNDIMKQIASEDTN